MYVPPHWQSRLSLSLSLSSTLFLSPFIFYLSSTIRSVLRDKPPSPLFAQDSPPLPVHGTRNSTIPTDLSLPIYKSSPHQTRFASPTPCPACLTRVSVYESGLADLQQETKICHSRPLPLQHCGSNLGSQGGRLPPPRRCWAWRMIYRTLAIRQEPLGNCQVPFPRARRELLLCHQHTTPPRCFSASFSPPAICSTETSARLAWQNITPVSLYEG
ncbi:hypothetical protein LX36DRAFT_165610 [Colletotrichum falcatum]|nr:hypothetical protein LX36DRAFT_165610 [Colletotrichum falcatum]